MNRDNSIRRSSFWDKLKRGEAEVRNPVDARQLFTQLLKRGSPEQLALTCDEALLPVLSTALGITANSLGPPLELLAALGAEQLSHGAYASRVLRIFHTFWEAPGFMQSIEKALVSNTLRDPAVVAWMLIKLAPEVEAVRQCKDPWTAKVVELLHCSTAVGMSSLAPQLATLFSIVALPSGATLAPSQAAQADAFPESLQAAKSAMRPPGVRDHDNDPADYRSISILPTPAELNCQEPPYLPPVGGSDFIADREAAQLDRLVRLMREDLLGSLREELAEELAAGASSFRRLYRNPQLLEICFEPQPYVLLSVPVPSRLAARVSKMKAREASDFFHHGPGRRVLAKEALVLLMEHASSSSSSSSSETPSGGIHAQGTEKKRLQLQTLAFGVVVMRKGKDWDMVDNLESGKLQVGVSFPGETSMAAITQRLVGLRYDTFAPTLCPFLFSASASYFTYEPVLLSLQRMSGIPLRETLAHMEPPGPKELPHGGRALADFSEEIQAAVQSDSTQSAVLQMVLTSKVVLIQGPPGTGKTYIGVQMVKAILEAHSRWGEISGQSAVPKIMCLSFTNHATDSFLESLMDVGVPESKIIRLGSSSKISARLKSRCLWELPEARFSKSETYCYAVLKNEQEELTKRAGRLLRKLKAFSGLGVSPAWWAEISDFLADEEERRALKNQWNSEWLQMLRKQLAEVMQKMSIKARSLDDLQLSRSSHVLSTATIIGCTTVGAARMRGILQEVKPDIVLVEEAGEILEAQVLSAIGDNCKQLILIGDHQQLRPKAECYKLRREAGNGFDMDVSLFERLVKHGGGEGSVPLPSVTLQVQHRMRPEVPHLIRHTMYPQLVDHASTLHHPRVQGIARPVLFINHNHPEAADADAAVLGGKSKVNMHEVQMVCRTAKYLLQQSGCSPASITILTPYLGQLAEIRKALVELRVGAELNDMDVKELQSLNLMDGPAGGEGWATVRAATVDNFQGEESDIVLISTVRSNPQGDIGFLSSAERVNVLLSRARNGMYLFGNMDCLTNCRSARGRDLWGRLAKLLRAKGQLLDFLPAVCERHKSVTALKELADFDRVVKHGGCTLPCGEDLPCGHPCPLLCHPKAAVVHAQVKCALLVPDVCDYGHQVQRKCCEVKVKCTKVVQWKCVAGHTMSGRCHQGRSAPCKTCEHLAADENAASAVEEQRQERVQAEEAALAESQSQLQAEERNQGDLLEIKEASSHHLDGTSPTVAIAAATNHDGGEGSDEVLEENAGSQAQLQAEECNQVDAIKREGAEDNKQYPLPATATHLSSQPQEAPTSDNGTPSLQRGSDSSPTEEQPAGTPQLAFHQPSPATPQPAAQQSSPGAPLSVPVSPLLSSPSQAPLAVAPDVVKVDVQLGEAELLHAGHVQSKGGTACR
eukprot:gene20755-27575_t